MLKKIILVIFLVLIIASSVLYYVSSISKYIATEKTINTLIVIQSSEETSPEILKLFLCQYNPKTKNIQILFIDENIVILQKRSKTRTLKEMFYIEKESNRTDFIKREIVKLFYNTVDIDYYVYCDTDTLNKLVKLFNEFKIKKLFGDSFFYDSLNNSNRLNSIIMNIKIIKYIIANFNRSIIVDIVKFFRNKNIRMLTNFNLLDCISIGHTIKNIDIKDITFIDIPTVGRRNRIEIDNKSFGKVIKILNNDYEDRSCNKVNLKILNASNKNRLADKAVNILRRNSFDVFYWGNESSKNNFTIVLDMINNHEQSSKIVEVLGCGEVLVRPNPKPFADITVLLGNDCNLYDKLDKIDTKIGDIHGNN